MTSDDLRYWLALNRTPGIGPKTCQRILAQFGSVRAVFDCAESEWRGLRLSERSKAALRQPDWAAVDADLAWADVAGQHAVSFGCQQYPERLRELSDPPPVLYVRGDVDVLHTPQLGVVGSRNPTTGGTRNSRSFAEHLAKCGITITSGLAKGIDAAAHQGALAGGGLTIAVCGTGPDVIYPKEHAGLVEKIIAEGALVTEFPPGVQPRAEFFPRRNRIISALSIGVLVVEAAQRSGSLITARLANEQGREVLAIPGSIHNPLARGCHQLIRQGAKLVESGADIFEELTPHLVTFREFLLQPPAKSAEIDAETTTNGATAAAAQDDAPTTSGVDNADHQTLLDAIGYDPTNVDELVARTGFSANEIASMLVILELQGLIDAGPGSTYTRTT